MEVMLFDRLEAIKKYINEFEEENFYISFSGGKDSTLLHYLVDEAIPGNRIPRVFINTGIEYKLVSDFVHELMVDDKRFVEIKPSVPIKSMLDKYGYPFKSKEHSKKLELYQRGSNCEWLKNYLDDERKSRFKCPKILKYQFNKDFKLHISDKCCQKLKKQPAAKWEKDNNKSIVMTGMRIEEGGQRISLSCIVVKNEKLIKFHPLATITDDWENWYIKTRNIKLCDLYYPPFEFKRTGCKGCPFSLDLQEQLSTMELYLPNEAKQCEVIWKPVYDEYRRLNYRLKQQVQLKLF